MDKHGARRGAGRTVAWIPGVLALLCLAGAAWASGTAGTLDADFGTGGVVATPTGGPPAAVAVQADGRAIVAGYEGTGAVVATGYVQRWVVRRYEAGGALDATFASGGTLHLFGTYPVDKAHDVAVDATGRMIIVGTSGVTINARRGTYTTWLTVVRLLPGGTLDPTFGTGGIARLTSGGSGRTVLVLQPDGRIVLAGAAYEYGKGGSSTYGFRVVRVTSSGALDTGFDGDGIAFRPDANAGVGYSGRPLALQSDGKIVVGGGTSGSAPRWALARFHPGGGFDGSLSAVGPAGDRLWSLRVDAQDRIVAVGSRNMADALVRRYLADGTPDAAFGSGGVVVPGLAGQDDFAFDVEVQPADGRIVVALGFETGVVRPDGSMNYGSAPLRLLDDGTADPSYGVGGLGEAPGVTSLMAYGLALDPWGRALSVGSGRQFDAAGNPLSPPSWILARYLAN